MYNNCKVKSSPKALSSGCVFTAPFAGPAYGLSGDGTIYEKDIEDDVVDASGNDLEAITFYEAALQSVPFLEDTPPQTPAPTSAPTPAPTPAPTSTPTPAPTQADLDLMSCMAWMVGSDSEQGGASDDESYGKVEETAPHRAFVFSCFGFGLWFKGLLPVALPSTSWVLPVRPKTRQAEGGP